MSSAYDIGRKALASGLGIFDVVSLHQEAVLRLVRRQSPAPLDAFIEATGNFLGEALSPYEMSHRAAGEANSALRRLNDLLEEEAKRIAHALHNQAGSILASASLELDLALADFPPAAQGQIAGARRLLDETGEQLRHLSHELRPTILDDLGLRAALAFLAEGVEHRTGLNVNVGGDFRERLPAAVETAIYRIVQEAINNTVIHGGQSASIDILLEHRSPYLRCLVVDDGNGFDINVKRGLGLIGMRERANAVGGTCNITSTRGSGTTVEILVPLDTPETYER